MAIIASTTARPHACDHSKYWLTPSLTGDSRYLNIVQQVLTQQVAPFCGNQERNLKEIKEGGEWKYEVLFYDDWPVGLVVYRRAGCILEVKNLEAKEDGASTASHATFLINRVKALAPENLSIRICLTVSGGSPKITEFLPKECLLNLLLLTWLFIKQI